MRRFRLPGPSLPDLNFLLLALFVPLLGGFQLLNSDGDLGRHLRLGEHMLTYGLLREDHFSFTKLGQPFIGHEWLSEIAFAAVYRLGGLPLVAVASGLLIAFTYAYVTDLLLRRGVDPLLAYLASLLAAVLGSFHWLARPHLFTLLGVALLLGRLERNEEGARPWTYLPLFACWVNVHGGFLFGLVLIGIYLAGDLVEALRRDGRAEWLGRARRHAAALGFALLGTLINPYGFAMPVHVLAWFKMSYVIDNTVEYLSPNFHALDNKFVLGVILLIALGLALSRRWPTWPRLLMILATIGTALIYQRNIPLMGLAALTALALHLDCEWRELPDFLGIRGVFQRDSPGRRNGPWAVAVTIPLLLLTVSFSPLSGMQAIPGEWSPRVFPVAAVQKAREARLEGRIYNEFIWGGYLLKEWPEMKVFIDGQTDFYGEALTRDHWRVGWLQPGWREVLRHWKVNLVLVPSSSSLAHELSRDPIWAIWHCDSTAVLLRLRPPGDSARAHPDSAEQLLTRCSPIRPLAPDSALTS
jgi:hypothetical protein